MRCGARCQIPIGHPLKSRLVVVCSASALVAATECAASLTQLRTCTVLIIKIHGAWRSRDQSTHHSAQTTHDSHRTGGSARPAVTTQARPRVSVATTSAPAPHATRYDLCMFCVCTGLYIYTGPTHPAPTAVCALVRTPGLGARDGRRRGRRGADRRAHTAPPGTALRRGGARSLRRPARRGPRAECGRGRRRRHTARRVAVRSAARCTAACGAWETTSRVACVVRWDVRLRGAGCVSWIFA
jgi:hypothetical protein